MLACEIVHHGGFSRDMAANDRVFRLLDMGHLTAAENMALDEVVLVETAARRSPPTLRFLQFDPPAVLVGRHQDVGLEAREDYCLANGIDVNRRITGGGAIYFQSSALGWELFGPAGLPPFQGDFEQVLQAICGAGARAVELLGPPARFRPRNDIEVDGRKISGTGGAFMDGGYMFQGTLLIENEIELFLRSLRVPVEKLKKREIESLQERVCFLSDLLDPLPSLGDIKAAYVRAIEESFGVRLVPGGPTDRERERLAERLPYFSSDEWVHGWSRKNKSAPDFWALTQTEYGTLRVHHWLEPGGRRIRRTLITGDFFSKPDRFVMDLEAALMGARFNAGGIADAAGRFFEQSDGGLIGIGPDRVIEALCAPLRRADLIPLGLTAAEANEIFFVNITAGDVQGRRPAWLLLPYCSKKVDCELRRVPDCARCGECEFDEMYDLADARGMTPYSIQSFEHLMEVLEQLAGENDDSRFFIGSCCEAFYAKHQREMEESGARGFLINLDSTTCYDLGKGMEAYVGRFENKTEMNCALIAKVAERLDGR